MTLGKCFAKCLADPETNLRKPLDVYPGRRCLRSGILSWKRNVTGDRIRIGMLQPGDLPVMIVQDEESEITRD